MNYYERHLGDYARDTGHLSLSEHGAYTLLLDRYYATEKPIPAALVYRVTRAVTPDEVAATDAVLREFFVPRDSGGTVTYHNRRADESIAAYREMKDEADAKREHETERKRRYRERRRTLFALLRDQGVIPDFNAPMDELEGLVERHCPAGQVRGQPRGHDALVPGKGTANQPPDSRLHQGNETLSLSPADAGQGLGAAIVGSFEGHSDRPTPPEVRARLDLIAKARLLGCGDGLTAKDLDPYLAAGGTPAHFAEVAGWSKCAGKNGKYVLQAACTNLAEQPPEVATGTAVAVVGGQRSEFTAAPSKRAQAVQVLEGMKRGNRA